MKLPKYIIGIDEAGRGPLAGPVAVGVVLLKKNFNQKLLTGVTDSKKLSAAKREAIYLKAKQLKKEQQLDYEVTLVSAKVIDKKGIVPAIKKALEGGLKKLIKRHSLNEGSVMIKLDGGLKAPKEFMYQQTIIKGDLKEYSIGLASILAKVTRDQYMEKIAGKGEFRAYDFAKHKGYGTRLHRAAIKKNCLSKEHRSTFCQNAVKQSIFQPVNDTEITVPYLV